MLVSLTAEKLGDYKTDKDSHHSSAPACYTWLISTSTAGRQETYSLLGCTDKPGTGTLLPTDPASSDNNSSSGGSKTNIGAIVGGVIGGILALLGIALFAWYFMRQRRRGREEHQAAFRRQRESALSGSSWADAKDPSDGGEKPPSAMYAVPRRKEVAAAAVGMDAQDRSMAGAASPATTMTTDRAGTVSPNEHLAYSVSSVSQAGSSQAGTGVVSSLSPVPPPLEGVVEAPDTSVPQESSAPVEVPGTTVTRDTMQNRAELA